MNDLLQAHMAIIALLESPLISPITRAQLEKLGEQLEKDIAELKGNEADAMAAG